MTMHHVALLTSFLITSIASLPTYYGDIGDRTGIRVRRNADTGHSQNTEFAPFTELPEETEALETTPRYEDATSTEVPTSDPMEDSQTEGPVFNDLENESFDEDEDTIPFPGDLRMEDITFLDEEEELDVEDVEMSFNDGEIVVDDVAIEEVLIINEDPVTDGPVTDDAAKEDRKNPVSSQSQSLAVLMNLAYVVGGLLIIALMCYCFGLCCCDCVETGKSGIRGGRGEGYQTSGNYGVVPVATSTGNDTDRREEYFM